MPELTLDYARKMAQQVLFNERREGNFLEMSQEDLAQHIMDSGLNEPHWYDVEVRKTLIIGNLFMWAFTRQGFDFWNRLSNS